MSSNDSIGCYQHQVLCCYPSDIVYHDELIENKIGLYLRKSPWKHPQKVVHNQHSTPMDRLLKYDEENNVYYIPIGVKKRRTVFYHPEFRWPSKYTILMWIKWHQGTISVFDSASYSPIAGHSKKLGCVAAEWHTIRCPLVYDKWQFVVTYGGDNCSKYYIGDQFTEPKFIGSVNSDVCGYTTSQIGNRSQGPGNIGCLMVFDEHKSMNDILRIYYESMIIMGKYWTKQEIKMIHEILIEYVDADEIVNTVFQIVFGSYLYNVLLRSS